MGSLFPGMDPFLEGEAWADFHTRYITAIAEVLGAALRPAYIARVEERVYLEQHSEPASIRPDVVVAAARPGGISATGSSTSQPVLLPLALSETFREHFVELRLRGTHELVTVLELLSPSNKRTGSDGRREYLRKRELVLRSSAHLIEMDFLRAGQRLPMACELPEADYYVSVSRASRRPLAEVWPVTLRQCLPTVPVPLGEPDEQTPLDLQAVFTTVYERAGYDLQLDYAGLPDPPLSPADAQWARSLAG